MPIEPIFLTGAQTAAQPQGQQNLADMTRAFKEFVAATKSSLHIAAYHFKFFDDAADTVRSVLADVATRAEVKIAYFDEPKRTNSRHRQAYGGDASGASVFAGYDRTKVQLKPIESIDIHSLPEGIEPAPIEGDGALMHSKYMIRDETAVWMGSANFTEDGWGLQDNNVLVFSDAPELARYYATDFDELWSYGRIAGTGRDDRGVLTIAGDDVTVDFSPGDGKAIDQSIADLIAGATASVDIASMVISSQLVLEAIDALPASVAVTGVYDGPQMRGVEKSWQRGNAASAKLALWQRVKARLVAKESKPFNPHDANGFYNFMHNKAVVIDRATVHTGSFNFSGNATRNAENVVRISDAVLAGHYADYIAALVARYKT